MSSAIQVTDSNFQQEVINSDIPVLVDFWAPWCAPCRIIAPLIEELANEYSGKFKVVKLNTDENSQVAGEYQIMGIPTLAVFVDGKMVDQLVGAVPKSHITDKLDYYLQGVLKN